MLLKRFDFDDWRLANHSVVKRHNIIRGNDAQLLLSPADDNQM